MNESVDGRRAELTRARILRVATDLFAAKGYHATSIAELQQAVGLERGGLYHHIGSKEAILFEICKQRSDEGLKNARRVMRSERDPLNKVRALGRVWVRSVFDDIKAWTVLYREFSFLSPERQKKIRQTRDGMEACWKDAIQQATDAGLMRQLPPVALNGILGMFNYAYIWLNPDGPLTPEEIADVFTDIILYGTLSPEAANLASRG